MPTKELSGKKTQEHNEVTTRVRDLFDRKQLAGSEGVESKAHNGNS
jgi:hypothetical protein